MDKSLYNNGQIFIIFIMHVLYRYLWKKKTFLNTSNIHTSYKFLGEEPCNKMELEINRLLLLLLLFSFVVKDKSPNSSVWAREESVLSDNLWSVLLLNCSGVCNVHYLYAGHWKKKTNNRFNIIAAGMFKFILSQVA